MFNNIIWDDRRLWECLLWVAKCCRINMVSPWCHHGKAVAHFPPILPSHKWHLCPGFARRVTQGHSQPGRTNFVSLAPGRKNPFFEICRICHILTQMMRRHFDPNTECHIWPVLGQTIWDLETPYLKKPFRSIWNERIAWTSSKCLKAKRISTHKLHFESTKITSRTPDWAWIFFRSVQQFRSFAFQNSTVLKLCSGWCLITKCEPL